MKIFVYTIIVLSFCQNILIGQTDVDQDLITPLIKNDTTAYLFAYKNSKFDDGTIQRLSEELIHNCIFLNKNCKSYLDRIPEDLSEDEKSYLVEMPNIIMGKSFKDYNLYLKCTELGVKISQKFDDLSAHYNFLASVVAFANMRRDYKKVGKVIEEMSMLPLYQDSFLYARYYIEKAFLAKAINANNVDTFYRKGIDVGERNMVILLDTLAMVNFYNSYSNYLKSNGEITRAVVMLNRGLKIMPNISEIAIANVRINLNLGVIYLDLENYPKAKHYLDQAKKIAETHNLISTLNSRIANHFGHYYAVVGEYKKSIENYKVSYKKFSNKWMNKVDRVVSAYRIGLSYVELDSLSEAKRWMALANKNNAKSYSITYLSQLLESKIRLKQKQYVLANKSALAAYNASKKFNSKPKEKECLSLLYIINKQSNRDKESLKYLEEFIKLDEYLYRSGQELAVNELQTEYEIDLREEKINTLNAQNEATVTKLSAQKTLTLFSSIGLIALSAFLFFLYKLNKKLKHKNELISKANNDKKILLKEIHHRVKNNLQVISSLLKLQSRYISDDNAIKAIAEGRSRVQSMALLHQNLYQDDNLKGVNMQQYFTNLIQGLFDAYNIEEDRITLETHIEDLSLDVDTVIPLGLITNELVSNALKHAFTNRINGKIIVKLIEAHGKLILEVADNGSGQDFTKESSGFGTMLIDSLSTKLDAEIQKSTSDGTSYKIIISEYQIAA